MTDVETLKEWLADTDEVIRALTLRRDEILSRIRHEWYQPPVSNEDYAEAMNKDHGRSAVHQIIGEHVMAGGQISLEEPGPLFTLGPVTTPLSEFVTEGAWAE